MNDEDFKRNLENMSDGEILLFGIGVLLKSGKITLEDIIEKCERDNERLRSTFSCHEYVCEKDSNKKNK